jgi:hypothetical protein
MLQQQLEHTETNPQHLQLAHAIHIHLVTMCAMFLAHSICVRQLDAGTKVCGRGRTLGNAVVHVCAKSNAQKAERKGAMAERTNPRLLGWAQILWHGGLSSNRKDGGDVIKYI